MRGGRRNARLVHMALAWAVVLVPSMSVSASASADEVTLARRYIGGGVAVSGQPAVEMQVCLREIGDMAGADAPDVGGGCFTDLLPMAPLTFTHVDVAVADEVSDHVVGRYTFRGSSGSMLGRALFCDAATDVAVPAGTWRVDVGVFSDVPAGSVCGAGPSAPTAGAVTLTLRRVASAG